MSDNSLQQRLGTVTPPSPTTADVPEERPIDNGMLKMLEHAFLTPVLSLLKIYLHHSNGSRRTAENCVLDFRVRHPYVFRGFFSLDFLFRLVYMIVVLVVVVRGLAIGEYLSQLF